LGGVGVGETAAWPVNKMAKLLHCYIVMVEHNNQKETVPQEYPIVSTGPLIYNDKGEILFVRGPKFPDFWVVAGGKVHVGETVEDASKREIKEELGIDIDDLEFLTYHDAINPEFYTKNVHFIFIDHIARYVGGDIKTNEEISEYQWVAPEEALKNLKIDEYTRKNIEIFLVRKEEKEIKQKCEEYKQGWQRAVADYKNLQKETSERRQLLLEMSEQQILEEFIPVYGHLKLAINNEQLTNNNDPWLQGVRHVAKQFENILKAHKVEEIKTVGEKFDPKFHETVGEEESDKEHGTILKEIDGGYTMGGRVIKVAKVIIAK